MTATSRLLALALGASLAPAAQAGTVLGPMPPVVGDGQTPATFAVYTDVEGIKVKFKPEDGKLEEILPIVGGYSIRYIPPAVSRPTEVPVRVLIRGAEKLDLEESIQVLPAYSGGFQVEFEPTSVEAGETAQVSVRPVVDAGGRGDKRQLRASVSVGEITDLVGAGDGSWVARYTAPSDLSEPTQAVLAIVDVAAPAELSGAAVLPVTVEREIELDAPAGSNNMLVLGGREYGPNAADGSGRVSFRVQLQPSEPTAQLQSVGGDGVRTDTTVDLPISVGRSLAIAPVPASAPGGLELEVSGYCVSAQGLACDASQVSWEATNSKVLQVQSPVAGRSVATVEVPDEGRMELVARMGQVEASTSVESLPSNVTIALTADPPTLDPDARDFSILARMKDPRGTGVIGRMPELEVEGASLRSRLRDNKDGTYGASYRLNSDADRAVVRATPPVQSSGLAPRRLVVYPESALLPADGASQTGIVVVAEDALGLPVPDVELTVSVPRGDGAVPPSVSTDDSGVARVPYTAGNVGGLSVVVVEGAGLRSATGVWQQQGGAPTPGMIPTGSAAALEAITRWQSRAPHLAVARAAPVPVAAPVAAPVASTAPAAPGETVAAPAAPAAAPAAPPSATVNPATEGTPVVRVRAGLLTGPFSYEATLDGESDTYPTDAGFELGGLFGSVGFTSEAEGWFLLDKTLGADVGVRMKSYTVLIADEDYTSAPLDLHIGPRYKFWTMDTLSAYGGLAYFQTTEAVFAYSNELKSAGELQTVNLAGARLAAGFRFEKDGFLAQLELAEAFVVAPSITTADVTVDVPIPGSTVGITAAAGVDLRYPKLSLEDGSAMKVNRSGQEISLGLFLPM